MFYRIDLRNADYDETCTLQLKAVEKVKSGSCSGIVFLVEHKPVFTIGKRGTDRHILISEDILKKEGIKVFHTDRGGDVTYHGPGQLVVYPVLNIVELFRSVKAYVHALEEVIIRLLKEYGIKARRKEGFPGVWLDDFRKIMSVGVAIHREGRKWISYHGIAFNVNTIMRHFSYINPCGLGNSVMMVSMEQILGKPPDFDEVKELYVSKFEEVTNIKLDKISLKELKLK